MDPADTVQPSYCRMCHNMCSVLVTTAEDGRVVRVTGDRSEPTHQGYSCLKGRNAARFMYAPDRLLGSLRREQSGEYVTVPTHVATAEVASRIRTLVGLHGPRTVAMYVGTYGYYESPLTVPVADSLLKALGSSMMFSAATIDQPGKSIARDLLGSWLAPPQGFDRPDTILIIGANPLTSYLGFPTGNPGRWLQTQLRNGAKLIVVDPRRTELARRAALHLQPQPGHDAQILAAILHVLIKEGLYDKDFTDRFVVGFDRLVEVVRPFTPDRVAAIAGLEATAVQEAARMYGGRRRGYAFAGTGANMAQSGSLLEYLVLVLQTLCGQWLRAGEEVRNPGVHHPTISAREGAEPSRHPVREPGAVRVRGLGQTASGMPTAALADEILLEGDGRVRALICIGGNPVVSWPDQTRTTAALTSLDLLVAVDPVLSQTARLADYVIAPRILYELEGVAHLPDMMSQGVAGFGSATPYARHGFAVAEAPKGSDLVESWQFLYRLAQALELELSLDSVGGGTIVLDMAQEPSTHDLLAARLAGSRVAFEDLVDGRAGDSIDQKVVVVATSPESVGRLDVGNLLALRDLSLSSADVDVTYPFMLLSRRMQHVHNSAYIAHPTGQKYNPAFMCPSDMVAIGAADGAVIEIRSARSAIVAVAHHDDSLLPGTLSLSHGFGSADSVANDIRQTGSSVARLLDVEVGFDRFSGQPRMSAVRVAIKVLQSAES